jgi:hypothetical protein
MLLDFRDIGQTGITVLSQQLGNNVKTNSNGEVEKDLPGSQDQLHLPSINWLSTMTNSSHLMCSHN